MSDSRSAEIYRFILMIIHNKCQRVANEIILTLLYTFRELYSCNVLDDSEILLND